MGGMAAALMLALVLLVLLVRVDVISAHRRHWQAHEQPLYRDATQPVNARVADLLARMNTDEKVAQLLNPCSSADAILALYNSTGIGGAWGARLAGGNARFKNAQEAQNFLQETVINNTRHGIPVSIYVEGLHGGPGGGTIFPSPVNMGNSWNVSLLKMVGAAVGHEARIGGCDRVFAPELQVDTDPRFGRFYESFAEDPHLVSVYGYFMTQGIQGPIAAADSYLGPTSAACEAKHMAAYGNAGKDGAASEVSEATFFNKYWPPWIMYAKAGGRGVMPSHQLTSAFMLPSHANRFMITGLWRGVLGMNQTFVSSDCGDVGEIEKAFDLATNSAQAASVALNAGVDQDLCVSTYNTGVVPALAQGLITQDTLDQSVSNILRQKFAAGLFEGSWKVDAATVESKLDTYRELAREVASQGITLLTNTNGTLPIPEASLMQNKQIVVIGSLANDEQSHVGGYTNSGADVVTIWEAVEALCNTTTTATPAQASCNATHLLGASPDSFSLGQIGEAAAAAAVADLIIAVVGDSTHTASENGDVDDLDLNGAQLPLLFEVIQANKASNTPAPVVVVVLSAQPKTFGASMWTPLGVGKPNSLVDEFGALLAAWRPGEEGGTAILDIITGKTNPSARLSHVWPAKAGQVHSVVSNSYHLPATNAGGMFKFTTGALAPLFPFGWGLSFSNFSIGTPKITLPNATTATIGGTAVLSPVGVDERFLVSVPVTTKGPSGRVTIQVYASASFQLVGQSQPANRLLCWNQAQIPAEGKATVEISCAAADLAMWDLSVGEYLVQGGIYKLTIAQYSGDPRADHSLRVNVSATAQPQPGQSTRDRAEAYSGVKL